MSGIEVAGLVLGAFPIAITLLEKYGEAAKRVGLFLHIRVEWKHWKDDLKFHEIAFRRHLRQLLLPLVFDDETIEQLMLSPGSEAWKSYRVAAVLEKRLLEAYELYRSYIDGLDQVMNEVKEHLALDSDAVQGVMNSQVGEPDASSCPVNIMLNHSQPPSKAPARLRSAVTKDGRAFQRYKIKFSNGESLRKRLFERMGDTLQKMEKLLSTGDQDSRLVQQRNLALEKTAVDSSLCNFWVTAKRLFKSLASAWPCQCQHHDARLLLEHRDTKKTEFGVTFTRVKESSWDICQTKITESEPDSQAATETIIGFGTRARKVPKQRGGMPVKSAMKSSTKGAKVQFCGSVYASLRDEGMNRKAQRFQISLVLASSVLQLLESPWLPKALSKNEVLFTENANDPGNYRLDQPEIVKSLAPRHPEDQPPETRQTQAYNAALDKLGILLLELCFGETLEQQPCRKRWPEGNTDAEKAGFDFLAAKEWHNHVNAEAGLDYADSVDWCLWGYRNSTPDSWRQNMLQRVIQPLQRCCDYLSGRVTV
ncbi:aldo keto reductase [Purpureocillium lavendulum]|uniref:Aldo keto reductase n=1 Tax=Purpureocillium lavendulum TaxID=1247861 RepID=A0AB34FD39_9HYPO|nr:aldo keto reductase [Purpureocillium lavendulum]